MWKSCDRGMESSPEDQTSLERDFKENAGGWFLPFSHNSKASHEHSEKKNDKGYILSKVSKVKNEKEKEEEYSTTSQKPPLLGMNLFHTLVRRILMTRTEFVKRILSG